MVPHFLPFSYTFIRITEMQKGNWKELKVKVKVGREAGWRTRRRRRQSKGCSQEEEPGAAGGGCTGGRAAGEPAGGESTTGGCAGSCDTGGL